MRTVEKGARSVMIRDRLEARLEAGCRTVIPKQAEPPKEHGAGGKIDEEHETIDDKYS